MLSLDVTFNATLILNISCIHLFGHMNRQNIVHIVGLPDHAVLTLPGAAARFQEPFSLLHSFRTISTVLYDRELERYDDGNELTHCASSGPYASAVVGILGIMNASLHAEKHDESNHRAVVQDYRAGRPTKGEAVSFIAPPQRAEHERRGRGSKHLLFLPSYLLSIDQQLPYRDIIRTGRRGGDRR
ncbi:hypothetical protein FISHEDRAFT_74982 [Fistulina hepatica ATCC 64428]|uniref:Uncharacterized protein n=1 Tax=Fistulina hepatica ATCC 64428 TaxID=1128425 RepID=A0A0D7AB01_9AGAR|nr:hypothetical protein FISHEDRAFT_74982 [Fistulina hepatica ATCC 64428]